MSTALPVSRLWAGSKGGGGGAAGPQVSPAPCQEKNRRGRGWEQRITADDKVVRLALDLSFLISPMGPQISAEYYR